MHDDDLGRAIRRAFSRFEMSAESTLPAVGRRAGAGSTRRARWLPRLAAPVVALAAGAAVVAGTLLPAQPAFASWSANPSGANPSAVAVAEDDCVSADPDHLGGLRLVGSERRGDYTMLLFGDGTAYGLCLTGPDIQPLVLAGPGTGAIDAEGFSSGGEHGARSDKTSSVMFIAQPGSDAPVAERVQAWVIGVTPDVARVTIERDGAEPTVATLGDGVAFAWWPAGIDALTVTAYDTEGLELQRVSVSEMTVTEH